MFWKTDEVEQLISDDVPLFDLTEHLLNITGKEGIIEFRTRHRAVVTGIGLIEKLAKQLEVESLYSADPGEWVEPGELVWKGRGSGVIRLWKIAQNLLEYGMGVATYTRKMVESAQKFNPDLEILTTRKVIPFTKKVALQGVMDGGGIPHRVTTTETILVFQNYINLFGGWKRFFSLFAQLKKKGVEKKWVVEADSVEMGIKLIQLGVDVVQLDKLPPSQVAKIVKFAHPAQVKVLAAGGIKLDNVAEYAQTGVDGIVTTAPYFAPSADLKVTIAPVI